MGSSRAGYLDDNSLELTSKASHSAGPISTLPSPTVHTWCKNRPPFWCSVTSYRLVKSWLSSCLLQWSLPWQLQPIRNSPSSVHLTISALPLVWPWEGQAGKRVPPYTWLEKAFLIRGPKHGEPLRWGRCGCLCQRIPGRGKSSRKEWHWCVWQGGWSRVNKGEGGGWDQTGSWALLNITALLKFKGTYLGT